MNKKSIKKNYIYNLIYQIVVIIVPLITTPYLSRVLGAENIGIYSYTISITTYFILVGTLGLSLYGQREIAYVQNDKEKRSKVFHELFLLKCYSVSIALIVFFLVFCIKGEYTFYYRILILELISVLLDVSWFFQGLEEFKKTVIRNVIVKAVSVIMIFLLVKNPDHLYIYFMIYVLSTFLGNLSLWFYLPKYIQKIPFSELKIKKYIKPAIILFIPQIATQIYVVLDKTMIGMLVLNKSEVGFYEQAQKIVKLCIVLSTALGTVMLPRMAATYATGNHEQLLRYLKKSLCVTMMLAFPLMFGVISIADKFVPLFFGDGYDKVTPIICLMSPIVFFIGLSNVTGTQFLLPTKQQRKYTLSVITGAVTNIVLNLLLIPEHGAIGACVATIAAEFSVTFIQFIMTRKYLNIKTILEISYKYLIAALVMFGVSMLINNVIDNALICIATQIVVSSIVYLLMLIILQDDTFKYVIAVMCETIGKIFKKKRKLV